MSKQQILAEIFYYFIMTISYIWVGLQWVDNEPFDALVLMTVTVMFYTYRKAVKSLSKELKDEL